MTAGPAVRCALELGAVSDDAWHKHARTSVGRLRRICERARDLRTSAELVFSAAPSASASPFARGRCDVDSP